MLSVESCGEWYHNDDNLSLLDIPLFHVFTLL